MAICNNGTLPAIIYFYVQQGKTTTNEKTKITKNVSVSK